VHKKQFLFDVISEVFGRIGIGPYFLVFATSSRRASATVSPSAAKTRALIYAEPDFF
jgi:hypothetical protein